MAGLPLDECQRIFDGESPLRVLREFRGFTIDQLADESRVHRNAIERAENGARPLQGRELRRVAAALDVLPVDLGPHRKAYASCCLAAELADDSAAGE